MKGHHYDFRQLKDHTTSPVPRARGGRTEMRAAHNPDVYKAVSGDAPYAAGDLKAPGARGKRRAARTRDGKARDAVSGAPVKHRADRRARGIQKRADGGYTGPYSGATGYVPAATPLAPGRFTAPAVPNTPDFTQQLALASIPLLGKNKDNDSKAEGQGIISGIKMPSGGTLGDATQDFFQDLGDWRGGAVRKHGGHVRNHQRKGKTG
jgi:hypothetical protein